MPLNEDNSFYTAGLYSYADYVQALNVDLPYDYEAYLTGMNDLSKYEVQFKCEKELTTEPTPKPALTIEENNGVFSVMMIDNTDTSVSLTKDLSCDSGYVTRKIVTISGLGEEDICSASWGIGNFIQFEYRKKFKFYQHACYNDKKD